MRHGLLRSHVREFVAGLAAERSDGGRENEAAYLVGPPGAQRLSECGVLGIHRDDLAGPGRLRDEPPADHERLLVGERKGAACCQCGQRGFEPSRTRDGVEHHVRARTRQLRGGIGPEEELREAVLTLSPATLPGHRVERALQVVGRGCLGQGHGLGLELDDLACQQLDVPTRG